MVLLSKAQWPRRAREREPDEPRAINAMASPGTIVSASISFPSESCSVACTRPVMRKYMWVTFRFHFNDHFSGVEPDPLGRVRDGRQRFLAQPECPFEPAKIHLELLGCRTTWLFVAVIHRLPSKLSREDLLRFLKMANSGSVNTELTVVCPPIRLIHPLRAPDLQRYERSQTSPDAVEFFGVSSRATRFSSSITYPTYDAKAAFIKGT